MVVGDLRRGLKGTIVMGGADVGGHRGPLFFVPFWEKEQRDSVHFSHAREKEPKSALPPRPPR